VAVVGFAGLGRMGTPMALNVLRSGAELRVWNRTAERCAPLVAEGATVAATPAELAAGVDVLVTMLFDAASVEDVLLGPDGALAALAPGAIVLEMSTIGPLAARALAATALERGVHLLDAPVSGSTPAAEAAQLTAMVGGDDDAFERARPVLSTMTKEQHHIGPSGAGAAMKVALNTIVAVTNEILAEALLLAEAAGIDPETAYDVFATSAIASPFVQFKRRAFLDPEHEPVYFTTALMQKDLALALELARAHRVAMPAAAISNEILSLSSRHGHAEGDIARVLDTLRESGS
jgi:3-hydroxyisobutyrate dehydrogenase-like beta-hydroxyacid dehydrogenase